MKNVTERRITFKNDEERSRRRFQFAENRVTFVSKASCYEFNQNVTNSKPLESQSRDKL